MSSAAVVAGFEAVAARTPDAVAVVAADGALTYQELNGRANRFAHELIKRGAGPERFVAVAVPRECALVVALLATLKAGAAYVPVDPTYPAQRIATILADAAPVAVLTTRAVRDHLPGSVVLVDDEPDGGDANPTDHHRTAPLRSAHPAYLLFTSGSTGRPKGVVVEHRALANVLRTVADQLGLTAADRLLAVASIGFDIATAEIFLPLLAGATVVIADDRVARDPDELAMLITRSGATIMQATPSLWRMLLTARPEALRGLRVLTAGEVLTPVLATGLVALARDVTNLYGPTEATIYATLETVTDRSPSIGRPIANLTGYVLDERLRPVPPGRPGELYLAGVGLARGYHGNQALTAHSFLPDPFGPAGMRMYRTGDLVRQRDGGFYEYLGRLDDQVKIRGVRVEPGEVERALEEHPAVGRVVVCAIQPDDEPDARLVAMVVPRTGRDPAEDADLRAFLAARLPEAFVPSMFVWSDVVPLGRTGKTDRGAVRALLQRRLDGITPGPGDDPLRELWTRCLGRSTGEDVGFRTAGGHSLSAARLIGAVEQRYGVRLPFRLLLHDDATLQCVRQSLATAKRPTGDGNRLAEPPAPPTGRVVVPPALRRLWVLRQLFPWSRSAYNVVVAAELIGEVRIDRLEAALTGVLARHDALRMSIVNADTDRPELEFPQVTCHVEAVDRADRYDPQAFTAESLRTELPPEAPMMAARLLHGPGRGCLVLVFDHLIADLRAATTVLNEVLADHPEPRPVHGPAESYRSYAARQHASVDGERWRQDFAYWRAALADWPEELRMPLSKPRPSIPSFRPQVRTVRLPADLSDQLATVAGELGTTWAGLSLGCFATLLHLWSGQPDLAIGVPTDARRRPDEQRLVAMAVDTLVVRSRVAATVAEVVAGCRDAFLAAADHASVPFDVLAERLGPPATPPRNPIFQAWFNDLGDVPEIRAPDGSGIEAVAVPIPVASALFDVGLYHRRTAHGHEYDLVGADDLFDEAVVGELADQFVRLLALVARAPHTPLADVDLRRAALAPAVPPRRGIEPWRCFEAFDHADPTAPAVVGPAGTVSYAAFRDLVRTASDALRQRGLRRGRTVAIWARSEPLLPVALLAVWRAGGVAALLPADAPARYRQACRDAVDADLCLDPAAHPDPDALSVADLVGPAERDDPSTPGQWPDQVATSHVLFTSGTTGTPAGVVVGVDAITDPFAWYVETFDVTAADRFALLSGPAHDPILRDMLVPLSVGATICVPPPGLAGRLGQLRSWLAEHRVTVLHATPALVDLIAGGAQDRLPALRLIVCGGETLTVGHLRRIRSFADAAVANVYGTTETPQIAACSLVLPRHADPDPGPPDDRPLPVGRGVGGRQVYVADPRGRPAAPGQRGEVVVRARNLATGYLGDTTRSDHFTEDPFGEPGFRLYRTGDEGHLTLDDEVVVTGRLDQQVSLAGYRIELAAVEGVARQFRGVVAARAALGESAAGPVLALAVAADPGCPVEPAALRTFLRGRLPRPCVPTVIATEAEALVLDPSRKLRIADWVHDGAADGPVAAPRSADAARASVHALHQLVEDILSGPVSAQQNLFDAGLTSMTMLQLRRAIARRLGPTLPVADLFAYPTITALADHLRAITQEPSR